MEVEEIGNVETELLKTEAKFHHKNINKEMKGRKKMRERAELEEKEGNVFRFVEKLERYKKELYKTEDIISFLRGEDIKGKKRK
jgi:uncharacterized membrane protein YgaE (UPF0421/DUF939 family)